MRGPEGLQPKLILADEPTGNLDPENEELVMQLFDELHQERHAFVVVTHDPEVRKGATPDQARPREAGGGGGGIPNPF